jgi:hypothetical protein
LILTEAVLLAALSVADRTLQLVILCVQDQPPAERRAAWQRWFRFWNPVWERLGLQPKEMDLGNGG